MLGWLLTFAGVCFTVGYLFGYGVCRRDWKKFQNNVDGK
jgi:hypothetical protein